MLRTKTLSIFKRLYHDSTFKQKAPVVKVASARVGRAMKNRLESQSQIKVTDRDPSRKFEPFPFAVTNENRLELVRKRLAPLVGMPYEEQLTSKQSYCRNSLRHIAQQLYSTGTPVRLDVRRLPCNINPIVKSTELYKYRNKDEFSIWRGQDGETITVGYMLFPISKHGDTVCVEPNGCDSVKDEVIRLVDVLQDFVRNQAKFPVCFSLGLEGGWRRFAVRSNVRDELMLIGQASPRFMTVQQVIDERENFRYFMVAKSKETRINLKSLYFQPCPNNSCKHTSVPYELIYGDETLTETINGHIFQVSPESYLPNSTSGAELLCNVIIKTIDECFKLNESGNKPILIDASCGIGLNAIQLAKYASHVIGIDSSSHAIEDARINAKLNGITNVEFICADLEIVIERVLEKYAHSGNEILVICNAPRPGVHTNVAAAMRRSKEINKIIYVTPKPDGNGSVDNLITLCEKPKGKSTAPFELILATPVDVLPMTETSELVIALERLPQQ